MSGQARPSGVGGALAVVIPHRSRRDLLLECLGSVAGWPVFVVFDDPAATSAPSGVVGVPGPGRGFAQAANAGLEAARQAGFRRVLLLNDDAVPCDGCVSRLLEFAIAHEGVGAVGPLLLDRQGRVESAGISCHVAHARVRQRTTAPPGPTDVDALSGACLLVDAWVRFDGRYPFYFEDVDLCRRIRRAGRRVVLLPDAHCVHVGGATRPRDSREAARLAVRGHLRLVGASTPHRMLALSLALGQVLREGASPERLRGVLEGWRAS
jgi:hypothetical protein